MSSPHISPGVLAEADQRQAMFNAELDTLIAALREAGVDLSAGETFLHVTGRIVDECESDAFMIAEIAAAALIRLAAASE